MLLKKSSTINFFLTFLILSLVYRSWFAWTIFQKDLFASYQAIVYLTLGLSNDLLLACFFSGIFLCIDKYLPDIKIKKITILCLEAITLLLIALAFTIQRKVFTTVAIGANYAILEDIARYPLSSHMYLPFTSITDWVYVFSSLIMYVCITSNRSIVNTFIYFIIPATMGLIGVAAIEASHIHDFYGTDRSRIFFLNPIFYAIQNTWRVSHNKYANYLEKPSLAQRINIALIDPAFISQYSSGPLVTLQKKPKAPMNVVIFILESVGSKYIFDTSHGNPTPMPFLKWLSTQGLWLNNNYAVGNISAANELSILTGLYPSPIPNHFEMNNDLHLPSLPQWLHRYENSVFITPTITETFFSEDLVKDAFHTFYKNSTIPSTIFHSPYDFFPEPLAFQFFLNHCKQMQSPFLAVYWSAAAHMPYYNFGKKYEILSIKTPAGYANYINNLNLLDHQLKQFYEFLREKKWLDNTLLVIVGDHGEGFGQHTNSWMHGTSIYNEEIKVPIIFYQPTLFKPQIITAPTSSVDILPTILDALAIPYNANNIQGVSLFKPHQRKYIFIYGDEGELAAIDNQENKMVIDFLNGQCKTFHLVKDPYELHPEYCLHDAQEKALLLFHNYQSDMLQHYNSIFSKEFRLSLKED